jgi:hypothetical protein
MLGTDRLFHGQRLSDGSRPADALLRGALEQMELACNGRMPYVWVFVSTDNDRSHALFDRHGFSALPYKGEGDVILLRAPSKRLPVIALRPPSTERLLRRTTGRGRKTRDPEPD